MKKLTEIYYSADERERHLILGAVLIALGLLLLVTKAVAGTPANGQSIAGFVSGICGLRIIWKETR